MYTWAKRVVFYLQFFSPLPRDFPAVLLRVAIWCWNEDLTTELHSAANPGSFCVTCNRVQGHSVRAAVSVHLCRIYTWIIIGIRLKLVGVTVSVALWSCQYVIWERLRPNCRGEYSDPIKGRENITLSTSWNKKEDQIRKYRTGHVARTRVMRNSWKIMIKDWREEISWETLQKKEIH